MELKKGHHFHGSKASLIRLLRTCFLRGHTFLRHAGHQWPGASVVPASQDAGMAVVFVGHTLVLARPALGTSSPHRVEAALVSA